MTALLWSKQVKVCQWFQHQMWRPISSLRPLLQDLWRSLTKFRALRVLFMLIFQREGHLDFQICQFRILTPLFNWQIIPLRRERSKTTWLKSVISRAKEKWKIQNILITSSHQLTRKYLKWPEDPSSLWVHKKTLLSMFRIYHQWPRSQRKPSPRKYPALRGSLHRSWLEPNVWWETKSLSSSEPTSSKSTVRLWHPLSTPRILNLAR